MDKITAEAREARNAYHRKWAKENRDRVREYERRHWEKVALNRSKSLSNARSVEGGTD